jgi:Skp family chaperone for outer membrane proteins
MTDPAKPRRALCPRCGWICCDHLAAEVAAARANLGQAVEDLGAEQAATHQLVDERAGLREELRKLRDHAQALQLRGDLAEQKLEVAERQTEAAMLERDESLRAEKRGQLTLKRLRERLEVLATNLENPATSVPWCARTLRALLAGAPAAEPQCTLPCGCVTCTCRTEDRCLRCGAHEAPACQASRLAGGPRHVPPPSSLTTTEPDHHA